MNQKQLWNKIAPEWHKFKKTPSREVEKFLKNKKGKILDLGSGAGRNLVKTKGKFYLIDFSEEMIKFAKLRAKKEKINAEFFVSEAEKLPFANNFFDTGICVALLHCIKGKNKREKIIKELHRVLKPKSQTLIAIWNKNSPRFKNSSREKYVSWTNKGKRYYYLFEEKEIHNLFEKQVLE